MKKTFYFSHDFNARNDPKLQKVLMKLGQAGKGVFWDIIEMLYEQGGYLLLNSIEEYAFALRTNYECINSLIYDFDLFVKDEVKFWSESVLLRIKMTNEKSKKAGESAHKRWDSIKQNNANASEINAKAVDEKCEGNAIKDIKVKDIKRDDIKEKEILTEENIGDKSPALKKTKIKGFKSFSKEEFRESLSEYEKEFSTPLILKFFAYWTEPDEKGRMRFQLQKTWGLKLRLTTWKERENNNTQSTNGNKKPFLLAHEKSQQSMESLLKDCKQAKEEGREYKPAGIWVSTPIVKIGAESNS